MGGGRFAHPVPARGAPAARPAICERAGGAAVAEQRGRGEVGEGEGRVALETEGVAVTAGADPGGGAGV